MPCNWIMSYFHAWNSTGKKSLISRRFIIGISIIYSVMILAASFSFHYSMGRNSAILRDTIASVNHDLLTEKTEILAERLGYKKSFTTNDIKREIESHAALSNDLLSVIMYKKTEDENFFQILDTIQFPGGLGLKMEKNSIVREDKKINYLKKGLLNVVVDPDIYRRDNLSWQNIYHPCVINNKKAVIQYMFGASQTREAVERYLDATGTIRLMNVVISVVLVIAVTVLTIIFVQNYTLLLRNLSVYMKKAAGGDLDVSLNTTADIELSRLAESFNTLIEELKDKTGKAAAEPEGTGVMFGAGVALLKENRLEEAIAIFTALTIVKPGGFGGHFNLGVARAKNREYAGAIAAFEEAYRLNPSYELTARYIEKIKGLQNPDA